MLRAGVPLAAPFLNRCFGPFGYGISRQARFEMLPPYLEMY